MLTDTVTYDTEHLMDNVETQIKSLVDSFTAELSALVRKGALEAVSSALKSGSSAPSAPKAPAASGKKRGPAPAAAKAPKAAKVAPPASAASKRKAGQKRSPDEIAKTTEKLLQYVSKNSGQRIEEIAKGVGTNTKELTLPIKKLLVEKKISSKGEKRATRYYVGGK